MREEPLRAPTRDTGIAMVAASPAAWERPWRPKGEEDPVKKSPGPSCRNRKRAPVAGGQKPGPAEDPCQPWRGITQPLQGMLARMGNIGCRARVDVAC